MEMKYSALAISIAAFSFNVHAIVNGTLVSNNDLQQMVSMNCSGNIIGGKWVLTAAHCALSNVTLHDGTTAIARNKINHPSFDGTLNDIGFVELESVQATNKINTLSVSNIGAGEAITVYGFGNTAPQAYRAVQTSEAQGIGLHAQFLRTVNTGQGSSISGDSGMSYLNAASEIVAVHNAGSATSTAGMQGFRIELARQFILDTVKGWHYPTNLEFNGNKVITVQSLHIGGTTDVAYTTGDVTIDYASSTCDDAVITEYGICTYSINSTGGQGTLHLSGTESIQVNKLEIPPSVSDNSHSNSNSSGGGSFGLFSTLSLALIYLRRKANK